MECGNKEPLNTGDIVKLKSGGPQMTVRYYADANAANSIGIEQGVHCDWINESGHHKGVFLTDQLEKYRDEEILIIKGEIVVPKPKTTVTYDV